MASVVLELILVHETEIAWLVDDGERQVWLPKSRCEFDGNQEFTVPEWLAIKEGLV